jgi:DNA-binding beta-propeller fold protein YncE
MKFPISKTLRAGVSALFFAGLALAADSGYHLLNTYKFDAAPGSTGEYFDYVTVDAPARRVYLSRGTAVQVINADTGTSLGFIPGFQRQHGVALAPEFNHGFISDGGAGKITVFDLTTLKALKDVKADPDTDCMVYDPVSKQAFSMNGDGNSSTVVNAQTGDLVKTIPLGGAPEFAVADGKGMIYANLADKNMIAAIDTKTLEVKSRWPVAPEGGPTALAIDPEHRRLFSAGRNPQILTILDADSGKVVQTFPISTGTDAAAYDPATGMIYVSTIEGNIHIFHEDTPDTYSVVDTVKTQYGAKTMGLDTKTHQLYLDTADFSAPPAQPAPGGRGGRRTPIAGTYRVLVYGK